MITPGFHLSLQYF